MRVFVSLMVLLAAGAFLLHFGLTGQLIPGRERVPPPNVVLVVIDALRADRLYAERNGAPVMPKLSAFARESATFTAAVSPASWTRPSMASLMTGLPVDQHQVYYLFNNPGEEPLKSDNLKPAYVTLAEYLKDYGYNTFGITTNGNLQPGTGFDQGFDEYIFYDYADSAPADKVSKRALQALETLQPPFFCYLHYMDPHGPYQPPADHADAFGPLPEPTLTDAPIFESNASFMDYLVETAKRAAGLDVPRAFPPMSEAGRERVRALYDAECHFADAEAARVLESVRAKYPDALIIVTADHGEEFWEHGGMGHGTTLYDEQLRVPLIVNAPDVAPGEVSRPVGTIGLARTIAGYIGRKVILESRPGWEGQDLLAPEQTPDPIYARTLCSTPDWGIDLAAIVEGSTKAIQDRQSDRMELYDVASDPAEQNDLSEARADEAAALRAKLVTHHQHAAARAFKHAADEDTQDAGLPPELMEQMEALGYLDGGTSAPQAADEEGEQSTPN
jgi:arylsulfatase A-like enzyme